MKVINIDEFLKQANDETRPKVDITPRGAEGGETYEDDLEAESDNENDE